MRVALDTNAYTDFMRGGDWSVKAVREAGQIFIPLPVIAELRAGFLCGTKSASNEQYLERFLNNSRVQILTPDEATTHVYARLYKYLREQETPIPINDLWIAATTLQHDLVLVTKDQHFKQLPQIPLFT